jgi:hypothetical protein
MLRHKAKGTDRIGKQEAIEPARRRTDGPLAPKISPTHLNACVSNAPSAQREQNPGGFVPKLFPNSAKVSGKLAPLFPDSRQPKEVTADPLARAVLCPILSPGEAQGSGHGRPPHGSSQDLDRVTQAFADRLRQDFAHDINRDPRDFKKQVLRLIRRRLPPQRGRPVNPKTQAALALLDQGKTVREILRLQIATFDQLDTYGRMLAEKGLRQAMSRQRRTGQLNSGSR